MSHFSVMVIGDNVEEQLAPYHEFECTGMNDQYVQNIDRTDEINGYIRLRIDRDFGGNYHEAMMDALADYGLEQKDIVSDESKAKTEGDKCTHKYGYAVVQDGLLVKVVNRTNPNKKWDWWTIGGRWSGFILNKKGEWIDQARKADIDFDGMIKFAAERASEEYDAFIHNSRGIPFNTFNYFTEKLPATEAREAYWGQAALKAVKENIEYYHQYFFEGFDKFAVPKEEYVNRVKLSTFSTYAFVKDSQWFARGDMGWFGMSDDKMTQEEWNDKFVEMLMALSDDTLITIVDCHI